MAVNRGIRAYNKLMLDEQPMQPTTRKIGRNTELIKQRNTALIKRFYIYSNIFRYPYISVINQLSSEFYLSPVTIQGIFSKNVDEILIIKKAKPSIEALKKEYPFINWRFEIVN